MRKSKTIKVGDREVTIAELTAEQVTALLEGSADKKRASTAELLMASPIPIEAVCAATGLSAEELNGNMAPSELEAIWQAVAEVNDFLLRMMERLQKVAEEMLALQASAEPPVS